MAHTLTADGAAAITFAPATLVEEVLQNIGALLSTPKYSVPLDRNFGLSARFLDKPTPIAEARIIAEIIDAIAEYEPRAEIVNITFERDESTGKLIPRLEVEINGG